MCNIVDDDLIWDLVNIGLERNSPVSVRGRFKVIEITPMRIPEIVIQQNQVHAEDGIERKDGK